ncbi:MAG: hypothetical protein ACLTXH_13445 [Enterobacter hormaechei]
MLDYRQVTGLSKEVIAK